MSRYSFYSEWPEGIPTGKRARFRALRRKRRRPKKPATLRPFERDDDVSFVGPAGTRLSGTISEIVRDAYYVVVAGNRYLVHDDAVDQMRREEG